MHIYGKSNAPPPPLRAWCGHAHSSARHTTGMIHAGPGGLVLIAVASPSATARDAVKSNPTWWSNDLAKHATGPANRAVVGCLAAMHDGVSAKRRVWAACNAE
jgi:hypothetical protein